MKKATIVFCIKGDQVLLAKKTRKVGIGKWNGYGGKIEGGETDEENAVRELFVESGGMVAQKEDLEKVANVSFSFDGVPAFQCAVYFLRKWQGEATSTEEMAEPTWHPITNIPFAEMMPADKDWITLVLIEGKQIEGQVNFSKDGSEVLSFEWKPTTFS